MKKNDYILVIIVVVIAIIWFLMHNILGEKDVATVTVKVDGDMQGTYSLFKEQEILINEGSNVLIIKDGEAKMKEANCPDKLCVRQKAISKNNENIICLPNKVIVEVESNENSKLDAVTN